MFILPFFPKERSSSEIFSDGQFALHLTEGGWGPFSEAHLVADGTAKKTKEMGRGILFSTGYQKPRNGTVFLSARPLAKMIEEERLLLGKPIREEVKQVLKNHFVTLGIAKAPLSPSDKELAEIFSEVAPRVHKRCLIILGGMCAGKTTLAREIQTFVRGDVAIVDADRFRAPTPVASMAGSPINVEEHEQCLGRSAKVRDELLENGAPFILTTTGRNKEYTDDILERVKAAGYEFKVVRAFTEDRAQVLDRAEKRAHQPVLGSRFTVSMSARQSKMTAKSLDIEEIATDQKNWREEARKLSEFFRGHPVPALRRSSTV